jgi:hypothetical protein
MKLKELQKLVKLQPFRPFTIRLNNGATCEFATPEAFGAPKDLSTIFHFGDDSWTILIPENITEIKPAKGK